MERYIQSADELVSELIAMHRNRERPFGKDFVYIDSSVRNEFMTSGNQNKITVGGEVRRVKYHSMGSGVYKAFIDYD